MGVCLFLDLLTCGTDGSHNDLCMCTGSQLQLIYLESHHPVVHKRAVTRIEKRVSWNAQEERLVPSLCEQGLHKGSHEGLSRTSGKH